MSLTKEILADAPTSYWPLDEVSGTAKDLAGNDHPGTPTGGVTRGITGLGWKAIDLDGASGYVSFVNHSLTATGSTAEIWFRLDTLDQQIFFGKSANNNTYIYLNSATAIHVQGDTAGAVVFAVPTIEVGRWYHLVVTRLASVTRLYLNGVESTTGGLAQSTAMIPNQIGRYGTSVGLWLNGRVAHAAIYDGVALSLTRIQTHYQAGVRGGIVLGPGAYGTSPYGTTSYAGGSGNQAPSLIPSSGVANDTVTFTATATGRILFKATANDAVTFTSTASGNWKVFGQTWTADASQDGRVTITSSASGRVIVPADIPAEFGSQVISIDATGGTFTITINGETTAPLAWNASAADVQAALLALAGIDPGDVTVTGSDGGPWTLNYAGQFTGSSIPTATVNTAGLTGGTSTAIVFVRPKLFIQRVSLTMPAPVLNSRGQPI